ncbi:MAG: threonylcarbamoyl-AMP synthase [Alphaproteobacteria bacterium]|nr:threonylcarbamoyl-AMP synthase [Alphaproteobacteria bacterium]OJV46453.1 MAG: threonylcarbamoyl-AMP synthase [Alphaproteobacteria bacterium 43-37]
MESLTTKEAVKKLKAGKVIVFPTETVYGLGADASNDSAVASVYEIKNRPTFNPLIIHYSSIDLAKKDAVFNENASKLAAAFWPGPLTLVLQKKISANISLLATAGLDTVAIRIPSHPLALELLDEFGGPIAAPSANPSGYVSPTSIEHVKKMFHQTPLPILDGGSCTVGLESTIIDLSDEVPILLRPGGITEEKITRLIGPLAQKAGSKQIKSPGQQLSHYAPKIPLRMKATYVRPKEAYLGFGKHEYDQGAHLLNLSPKGDLIEAAANLFAMLHELDDPIYDGIAVAPIPETGLGVAINDRLKRAAGERPIN